MRKFMPFLLAALLLFGCTAPAYFAVEAPTEKPMPIGDVAAAMEKAAAEATFVPIDSSAIAAMTEPPLTEEELNALSPLPVSEHVNTHWHDQNRNCLAIFDGFMILYTDNEVLWLTASGDGYDAETHLYRTPDDTEPALILPAGEIRILEDGDALRLQTLSDPLGILSHAKVSEQPFNKQSYAPYQRTNWNLWRAPSEPQTEWETNLQHTDGSYLHLSMKVNDDLSFTGTLKLQDGTVQPCTLLCSDYSYALTADRDGSAELLFYAEWDMEEDDRWRNYLAKQEFELLYDSLELDRENHIRLWRFDGYQPNDMRYMCGVNLDTVILNLMRDGWTERPITELHEDLEGWFAWLIKDGESMLLYYDEDFLPYGDERFLMAYVHYGADGSVLDWSGERPIDHAIADAYQLEKDVYFEDSVWGGMFIHEDGYAYFLDDGRVAVEWVPHEGGGGDLEFYTVKVIP